MKSIKKLLIAIFSVGLLGSAMVSCSEDIMDDINRDTNNSTDALAKFILADVLTATSFSNTGGDFNTYFSTYVEHEVGTHNQLYNAEHRSGEPSSATTFNNVWGNLYTTLSNAKIIVSKCSEGGSQENDAITRGVGKVMAAYNLALITDMFGDTPWTEACDYTKFMNPKVDKQEDIYKDIMAYIDGAIADLDGTNLSGSLGSYDFIYGGNAAKWKKFAYGLKARYTMRLMNRSSNVTQDMNNILTYVSNSFASADDQAAFAVYDATNLNPLFDFQWSRDGIGASQSIVNKLVERNDPRIRRVFVDPEWVQITGDDSEYWDNMAPNGKSIQSQGHYNYSIFTYAQTAPTLLLSYHEVLFLKAEALCRLNRTDEAEAVLKEAIIAAMANTEVSVSAAFVAPSVAVYGGLEETTDPITAEEAGEYFDNDVLPLFTANPLQEVMNQKYLAFFGSSGESTETYNDIRRMKALGENFIKLENTLQFPLRCPYGADDTTTNPNIQSIFGDGTYVYTENVWWAGGNR